MGVSKGGGIDEIPLPRPCHPRWLMARVHLEALSPLHFVSGAPEHVVDTPPSPPPTPAEGLPFGTHLQTHGLFLS